MVMGMAEVTDDRRVALLSRLVLHLRHRGL